MAIYSDWLIGQEIAQRREKEAEVDQETTEEVTETMTGGKVDASSASREATKRETVPN